MSGRVPGRQIGAIPARLADYAIGAISALLGRNSGVCRRGGGVGEWASPEIGGASIRWGSGGVKLPGF